MPTTDTDAMVDTASMDETRKRAVAERLAAMMLMVPSAVERSVRESLAALEEGEDFDDQVRALADRMLADPSTDWREIERIAAARTAEELIDPPSTDEPGT